jgi:hypothetical protein
MGAPDVPVQSRFTREKMKRLALTGLIALSTAAPAALGDAVTFTGTGSDADVTAALNTYRAALGTLNPNNPGSVGSGRREINWDGVPDSASAPNAFPADFFNANTNGRARGTVYSTPGSGFQTSADSDNPTATPIDFANLNAQYGGLFRAFSAQRLFTAVDSTITDVNFFIPGSSTPATVSGFGAVFSDVDLAGSTYIEFYDASNALLTTAIAPVSTTANEGASFVGVQFTAGEQVSRVRIVSGNVAPGATGLEGVGQDVVTMDDFIYGEPVPEPTSLALLGLGALSAFLLRRA